MNTADRALAAVTVRPGSGLDGGGAAACARSVVPVPVMAAQAPLSAARDPYARLARGCRPRGCRAPARRVHGRRVRYVIGDEPGQVNGMRWRRGARECTLRTG
ncbi:tryptophan biosynthesis modulator TrpM [Streptomyces avermitilis]|uniref:tryptophan biosynthesis modulator TrpM n=1 Tax=Streptomyces avermitilis TaxID=33903 RepID=UPI00339DF6A8